MQIHDLQLSLMPLYPRLGKHCVRNAQEAATGWQPEVDNGKNIRLTMQHRKVNHSNLFNPF
jgi:hypothetical protein